MSSILKLTRFIKNPFFKLVRFNSTVVKKESIFFDSEVQTLLRQLTGLDYDRVFRTKKMGTSPHRPIYQEWKFHQKQKKWIYSWSTLLTFYYFYCYIRDYSKILSLNFGKLI